MVREGHTRERARRHSLNVGAASTSIANRRRLTLLGAERQRDAIRPPEAILRRVLAAPRSFGQIGDVVLLGHFAGRLIRAPIHAKPPGARIIREIGSAV